MATAKPSTCPGTRKSIARGGVPIQPCIRYDTGIEASDCPIVVGSVRDLPGSSVYCPRKKRGGGDKRLGTRLINRLALLVVLAGTSNISLAANVGSGGVGTAFAKNSTSVGVVVGSGSAFDDDYIILGIGVGYYLAEGLELGVDLQRWFSGEPTITKVSPQIRYVFTQVQTIKPYVGAFYRRTSYDDLNGRDIDDQDSIGYRAGAYFSSNNRVYIGAGIVYEEFDDCSRLTDCSTTSPEILFTVSF